jgi:hypothetical protein
MPNNQELENKQTAIVYISTEHATSKTPDGAGFRINMDNSLFAENVSGCAVVEAVIPNIFPNINVYRQYFAVGDVITQVGQNITIGQYTGAVLAEHVTSIFGVVGQNMTMAYSGIDFIFSNFEIETRVIDAPAELWEIWGWDWRQLPISPESTDDRTLYRLVIPGSTAAFAPNPSALYGEKIVHVSCDQLARANMVHGSDGKLYDILCSLPMAETEFFRTLTWQPPEDSTQRINFKHTKSITSSLDFTLHDSRMRRLPMPLNHHVQLVLKIYHSENGF